MKKICIVFIVFFSVFALFAAIAEAQWKQVLPNTYSVTGKWVEQANTSAPDFGPLADPPETTIDSQIILKVFTNGSGIYKVHMDRKVKVIFTIDKNVGLIEYAGSGEKFFGNVWDKGDVQVSTARHSIFIKVLRDIKSGNADRKYGTQLRVVPGSWVKISFK
jgi:hypothetical protein